MSRELRDAWLWFKGFLFGVGTMILLALSHPAKADMITEFGGGFVFGQTNPLARPECQEAWSQIDGQWRNFPCGGSDPVFIGWPIAWESPNGNTRIGWFHMSHWFSGVPFNSKPELVYNCICVTHTFHWRNRR